MKQFSFSLKLILFGLMTFALLSCATTESRIQTKATNSFSFTYSVEVNDIPAESQRLDIYLPLPSNNAYQTIGDVYVDTDMRQETIVDRDYGNRIIHLWQDKLHGGSQSAQVRMSVTRELAEGLNKIITEEQLVNPRFLQANQLVPIDGSIADEADGIWRADNSTISNIRAIYDHLFETMSYDKSGFGWGHGDAVRACDVRSGNCTDIHSLFIGMLRSKGVPARFIIGFPVPKDEASGTIGGYHCWAEFYDEERGWIPVDLSEAIKHPEKKDFFFGNLDADRVAFSNGRDIMMGSTLTDNPRNYFIYPYVLVDGKQIDGIESTFSFKRQIL